MKLGDLNPNICQLIFKKKKKKTIGYQIYSFYQLQVVTALQYLGFMKINIYIGVASSYTWCNSK